MKIFLAILLILGAGTGLYFWSKKADEKAVLKMQQDKCAAEVSTWIKKHALYPADYHPIEFKEYVETGTQDETGISSARYSIFHSCQLKNVDGNIDTFAGYFRLIDNYEMNIIEEKDTAGDRQVFPPMLQNWNDRYGRPFTAEDSAGWKASKQQRYDNILEIVETSDDTTGNKDSILEQLKLLRNK